MIVEFLGRGLLFLAGWALVFYVLFSAIRTVVVPRGVNDFLSRQVFRSMRWLFDRIVTPFRSYRERDRIMAMYAPLSLLMLPVAWLILVATGYTAMFWALGGASLGQAFTLSGSSLLTLGFAAPHSLVATALALSEAAFGLALVALMIAYLPTIYSSFSRREISVTQLETRAGSPPSAPDLIERYNRIHGLNHLGELWDTWEAWFVELGETHTSIAVLSFFRSPRPQRSWVTAAGTVLDTGALALSTLDVPNDPHAALCMRSGFLALRYIAELFKIPVNPNPTLATEPISISRLEYDAVYDRLKLAGVPLKDDREQAWKDFAGWRVNYDFTLLALANLTMAAPAPWTSDRMPRPRRGKPRPVAEKPM